MANLVKLDAGGFKNVLPNVKKIHNDVNQLSREISKTLEGLDMTVAARAGMEAEIADIVKVLSVQQDKMNSVAGVIEEAAAKAEETNSWLNNVINAIQTAIGGLLGAFTGWFGIGNRAGNSDDGSRRIPPDNVRDKASVDEPIEDEKNIESNFVPRTSKPDLDSEYYKKLKNGPNCTTYAAARAREILGDNNHDKFPVMDGNAEKWFEQLEGKFETGMEPKPGALAVWRGPGDAPGHVAIVEEVTDKGPVFTESAAGGVWYAGYDKQKDCTNYATNPGIYNYYGGTDKYWGSALYPDVTKLYQPNGKIDANGKSIKVQMEFLGYVYLN